MNNESVNNNELLIAPAPAPAEDIAVIGGVDGPTAIFTTEVGVADNMGAAVQIMGQGMASIFVVLGLIAVVVAVLKKLDNKKK